MTNTRFSASSGQQQPTIFTTTRHQYALRNGDEVEVCIQSFDPRELSSSLPLVIPNLSRPQPWIIGIAGTVYIEPGEDDTQRPSAGKFGGLLIKRELIPEVEDGFLRHMMSVNSFTQQQAQQLFDSQGRLRRKFTGRGIWGSENDDSWIFEIGMAQIAPGYRREGVGRRLVECARDEVLTWAREEQREVLMILMLGAPQSEVVEHKSHHPMSSATDLQRVSSAARLAAKSFWRSLGFRRLSARSSWFGWARSVDDPGDHPFNSHAEWESEGELVKINKHDDDMAPDVAETYAWYKRDCSP